MKFMITHFNHPMFGIATSSYLAPMVTVKILCARKDGATSLGSGAPKLGITQPYTAHY